MNDVKPGYRTTEFWVTVAVLAATILAGLGVISPSEAETLKGKAREIADLAVKLIGALTPVAYIIARAVVKIRS